MPVFASIDETTMSEALAMRERGDFDKATRLLRSYLDQSTSTLEPAERRTVEFEIERIRRIRQDYTVPREKLLDRLKKRINGFTEDEFNEHERAGHFDSLVIDGQKFYVNSSESNLIFREAGLQKRKANRKREVTSRKLYEQMLRVKEAQKKSKESILLPQDYAVTYTLIVNANAAPDGKTVRCWLPLARNFPFQSDIHVLAAEPGNCTIAPPQAPHRTVYMERNAKKDEPTTFSVSFIYRCWARANEIDPAKVQPYRKDGPDYAYYTADRKPHIDLSNDELKKLNAQIVDGETNPYLIAKRIYDWIGQNCIYQYAREYSTLDNISLYVASRRAGDCGQHGMLFIALCRMNGIPARWQTGWESFSPSGQNMHDWSEFYVEPYGWLPADSDMAVNIYHDYNEDLDTTQIKELADWLFGNMDNYRLAVNCDFSAPLFPPKSDFRSETVDFQRGEAECEGKNLYFDQWDYTMDISPIPADRANAIASALVPEPVKLPALPETFPEEKPAPKPEAKPETTATAEVTSPTATPAPAPPKPAESKETTATTEKAPDTSGTPAAAPPAAPAKPDPTPAPKPEAKPVTTPEPPKAAAAETSGTAKTDPATSGTK